MATTAVETIGPEGSRLVVGIDTIADKILIAHIVNEQIQVVALLDENDRIVLVRALAKARRLLRKHAVNV
jgi:hypothetical protein